MNTASMLQERATFEAANAGEELAVNVQGLHKKFGKATALESLDLAVRKGEFLVLLGPSGCGKTTTMRSIAGLEVPTSGTIEVGGQVVFDSSKGIDRAPADRNIGMVFQSYAIWPHRTVRENVSFPLKMQKVPRKEAAQRVDEVLALVGLEAQGSRSASMLSGGQMQRVALARSIVMSPAVLLLDEPLSNLDAKLREKLRVELKQTQQRLGTTSIYVTHDQAEALALADRVVLMRNGVIEQVAAPLELYRNPKTLFAAEFLGTNNLLKGRAENGTVLLDDFSLPTAYAGPAGDVSMCLRAEDFTENPPEAWAGGRVTGRIEVSSLLGSQIQYSVRVGGTLLEVLVPFVERLAAPGDTITLGVKAQDVRCFPTVVES
ncbi:MULTISPECIES: ABC transporter ATP-binding protein [unclassified Salinibacterium]|uniref:ABC transporter ATP-binding protein n=1 Tax=unclassified Salinibacterium TaxID=2632331 RepID=UPI001F0FDDA2|nr:MULTISPECIES: ABC transporter ATP-binding protein [unclassified Salinibacterium]